MRIAVFTDTYTPEVNGVVTSIEAHARLLAARGHEVLIVCPRYAEEPKRSTPGVTVRRYPSFSFLTNQATRIALPSIVSVANLVRRFDPDVVHVHTPLSVGVIGLVTARMLRLPNVQTYHTYIPDFMVYLEPQRLLRLDDIQERIADSLVFERMFRSDAWQALARVRDEGEDALDTIRRLARAAVGGTEEAERLELSARVAWRYTRTLYNRADLVLTPSVTLKSELVRHGVTVPVEYLSNGIDRNVVAPKASYAPTGRLLHAGRLGHEKNVDVVIRAFARVLERRPGCVLDVVGDGPAREGLERLAHRLGIADRVRMRGFMDRRALGRAYRDYDAFVTASTIETQGIVLLEAMSAGLPVVGVRALAIPELVRNGRDGLVVAPEDEQALADAMERLLADDALRAHMGAACRADVAAHAIESVVSRLEDLYARVAAAGRA